MVNIKCEDQYVKVYSHSIFVRKWIPTNVKYDQAPIVLFHDSLGCVEAWGEFPEKLAQHLNLIVIAYDRFGFGKSDARDSLPPVSFIIDEAKEYLPFILNQLNISKFIAFGHSVGGAMALLAAKYLPDKTSLVISESAQAFVEDMTRTGIKEGNKFFSSTKGKNWLNRFHGEKGNWVLKAWVDIWLSKEFSDWNLKNDLPKINCPVLVIHGKNDEYGSTAFPEMIAGQVAGPVTKKILNSCGHIPHKERPERVLEIVESFILTHND